MLTNVHNYAATRRGKVCVRNAREYSQRKETGRNAESKRVCALSSEHRWCRNTRKVDSTIGDSKTHTERIEIRGYTLNAKDFVEHKTYIQVGAPHRHFHVFIEASSFSLPLVCTLKG